MSDRKRIVLAGGSGFLGRALQTELERAGYQVIVLTRSPRIDNPTHVAWDGKNIDSWSDAVDGAAAVVNLTGKSVNCRYTPGNRKEIVASRVDSVKVLDRAISLAARPPAVWVQTGSLAIYGDAGDRTCDESAPCGSGFSVDTCVQWEKTFSGSDADGIRKVLFRIGFALGNTGGALQSLAKLARSFLGGTIGSGRQFISWLHVADLNRMFRLAIEREDVEGTFNATGPNPVTNREFMRELRRAVGRPWSPPVPSWAVRLGARMMGTEAELALTGRRCIPARFEKLGFQFDYPELAPALESLFSA